MKKPKKPAPVKPEKPAPWWDEVSAENLLVAREAGGAWRRAFAPPRPRSHAIKIKT